MADPITRLEYERKRQGISQVTLAVLIHWRQQDICLIEQRRLVPTRPKLKRLGAVLGVPPEDLLKPYPYDKAAIRVAVLRKKVAALEREVAG